MSLVGAQGAAARVGLVGAWAFERRWVSALVRSLPLRLVITTAFAVAGVHVALMLGVDSDRLRAGLFRRAMVGFSFVAALVGWAISGRRAGEIRAAVIGLLALRGVRPTSAIAAPAVGGMLLFARVLLPPLAVLSAARLGLAPNSIAVGRIVADVAGALLYVFVCAGALCATALVARQVGSERGRLLFFVLVVGPFLLSVGLDVPHVPGMLSDFLDLCLRRGAS